MTCLLTDPFEDKSAQQILTELPVLRVNVGTTAAGFAVRCATIGYERLLAQLQSNAAFRSSVASKQAALQHASLRSIAFAALGRSEGMCI